MRAINFDDVPLAQGCEVVEAVRVDDIGIKRRCELIAELMIEPECVAPVHTGQPAVFPAQARAAVLETAINTVRAAAHDVIGDIGFAEIVTALEDGVDLPERISVELFEIGTQSRLSDDVTGMDACLFVQPLGHA